MLEHSSANSVETCVYIFIYLYIYIFIYREREIFHIQLLLIVMILLITVVVVVVVVVVMTTLIILEMMLAPEVDRPTPFQGWSAAELGRGGGGRRGAICVSLDISSCCNEDILPYSRC